MSSTVTSTNGSPSLTGTSKKNLTKRGNASLLRDLPAILEACKKAEVSTLKCGDIEVTFRSPTALVHTTGYLATDDLTTLPSTFTNYSPVSEQPKIETVDRDLLEDMRRSQLMIDDPMSFEQEMIDEYTRRDYDVGKEDHSR
jgi:hypothetical protein